MKKFHACKIYYTEVALELAISRCWFRQTLPTQGQPVITVLEKGLEETARDG